MSTFTLSQDVDHHGVPHTNTLDHARGGMASDLCMMGDVLPRGDAPPPPTQVNSHHDTLHLIPATTRVHTLGWNPVQPLKNRHRSLLSLRISSRLFSFSQPFLDECIIH